MNRCIDDASNRHSGIDDGDVYGEIPVAADKFAGAIKWIDTGVQCAKLRHPASGHLFLRQNRQVRGKFGQPRQDQRFGQMLPADLLLLRHVCQRARDLEHPVRGA